MTSPLVETKFYVPSLRRGVVARPRLSDRLSGGTGARLTLVSAPAGFGKTTLLADWLTSAATGEASVAWLSLEQADSQGSFWIYVVSALQRVAPGVGASALPLLQSAQPVDGAALTPLLNDLSALTHDVWLVLDDYHQVDGEGIRAGMVFLLDHLPPQVRVVISTRVDPLLPLARMRARGELVEVRAADLRFTLDEATSYLNEVIGLHLAVDDVVALEGRTEGWIAALQLAALSMQGRDNVADFIAGFAGNDRYIVDYLVEEVLEHQPEPVRRFLLRTAVLDRLTGSLCDAVTGRADGADMLADLERANLFLVALDDRREWYRYHHLFADVLRVRLLAEDPDLVPQLHQHASQWYESRDLVTEAVRHALAAQEFERAAHLMEQAAPALRRNRQEATLLGWLRQLPDDTIRSSPVLSVFSGYMLMVSGDLDEVEPRFDDAERALAAADADGAPARWAQTDELRSLPSTIALYRASLAQARGDLAGTVEHARHALEVASPTDHLARGGAAGFLGLAAWSQGDVSTALSTFTEAVVSLRDAGALVDELSSSLVLGDMWLAAGRPSRAVALYDVALQRAEPLGDAVARATADLHTGLSEVDCELGEIESARRHLEIAAAFGERASMGESGYRWFVAMSRVAAAEDDPQAAVVLLEQAERLYRSGFFPDVRPIEAMKARIRIGQGMLSDAVDWAGARGVSLTDEVTYLREFDHLTLVRLVLAQHREHPEPGVLDRADAILDRLADAAESSGRAGSLLEIRMLRALVRDAQGERSQALELLARAWAQAPEPGGYVRLFLDEGQPMTALLATAATLDPTRDQARRLLAVGVQRGAETAGPTRGQASSPSVALSERELQVLRLLASELSGPEMARELFISPNTLRSHTKSIFTKLDVTSRRAAVRRARELGLT